MKHLIFATILISINSFANTLPLSEVIKAINLEPNVGSVSCSQLPDEPCISYEGITWEHAELVDNVVLDYVQKSNSIACETIEQCDVEFETLICSQDAYKIKNYELKEVYCARDVMKVDGKKLVNSPEKKAALEAVKASKLQLESAMAQARKAQDCGRSTMAYMLVRNAPKGLTTTQVKALVATYSPIKGLLESGSLVTAIEEIQAVEADGVLVTEDDKTALVSHINACK